MFCNVCLPDNLHFTCRDLYNKIYSLFHLQPNHIPRDGRWRTRNGGSHGKTSDVTEENASRPRLDPHTLR